MWDKVREDKMNINELLEPNAKKAVFTFGRFNPPTVGHARLMDVVKNAASGADHYVFTGRTNDPKKNPLEYKDKITFLRAMFPHMNIMDNPAIRTPWEALEELGKQYDEVVMVVGSDRKDDFEQQMRPYLKDFGIEKFSIVSSGERDADSNDVSGMSASKARAFARAGDFKSFSQSINGGEKLKQQVYNKVRQGMGITEMANKPKMPKKPEIKSRDPNWRDMEALRKSGAAGSHKDKKALDKRGYQKHKGKSYDINESSLSEILGFVTRPSKRTTIKKKPEKFDEPTVQDKIKARRAAAARGDKDAWKSSTQKTSEAPAKYPYYNMSEGKPIAYVDMDGVIANFFAEYAKLAGIKTGDYRDIPPAKVDPTLNKMIGTDFFNRLPKFPTTDKLIQMVVKEFGSYKILSSPLRGDHENSKEQKIKWIKRELSIQPDEIIVVGRKDSYAVQPDGTQNILIDDRGKNIQGWVSRGGYGVKYQADEDPLSKVSDGIKDFKEKNNLTEHGGRVVKGINTTVDVGVDAIKKQSAKMGFKVTKDGVPPILAPKNLRSVKRMQEALIKINGSNKDLTLQQQIDLQEIKKGIGKMLKATREVASEVPYQNDGGSMSLLTHPGTKLHQKMRATAKPGTDDWFKTWRTLAYLTKGRKNHYMLPVKEQLERLLVKHGILEGSALQYSQIAKRRDLAYKVFVTKIKNNDPFSTTHTPPLPFRIDNTPQNIELLDQWFKNAKGSGGPFTGTYTKKYDPETDTYTDDNTRGSLKTSQLGKTPEFEGQAPQWDNQDAGKEYTVGKTAHLNLHDTTEEEEKAVSTAEELISSKGIKGSELASKIISNPVLNSKEAQPHGKWIVEIAKAIADKQYPVPVDPQALDKENKKLRSFIQDYAGEYLGIAGLVYGLGDFPNKDAFLKFLGASDMQQLQYYFPTAQNTPLADSFGYIKSPSGETNMRISSKGGTTGAAPSLSNLKITPDVEKRFEKTGAIEFLKAIQEVAKGDNAQIVGTLRAVNILNNRYPETIGDARLKQILPLQEDEISFFNKAFNEEKRFREKNPDKNFVAQFPERLQPYVQDRQTRSDNGQLKSKRGAYKIKSNVGDFIMQCTYAITNGVNKGGAFPNFEPMAKEILGMNFMQIWTSVKSKGMTFRVLWPAKIDGKVELWSNSSQNEMNGRMGFRIH